jgi:hypothetical protein
VGCQLWQLAMAGGNTATKRSRLWPIAWQQYAYCFLFFFGLQSGFFLSEVAPQVLHRKWFASAGTFAFFFWHIDFDSHYAEKRSTDI